MPPEDAAIALPAADQPPVPAREIPFAQRLAAKEAELGTTDDDTPVAVGAPPEAKPKAAAADPKEAKRAQLKALADELGLALDDTAVSVAERAEHRAAIRRQKAQLEADREAFQRDKGEFDKNKGEKVAKAEAILAALESGDPDAFATNAGFKDFNDFQHNFLKRLADPNYSEFKKLEQKIAEKEAQEKKAADEAKQRQTQQERARAMSTYMDNLTAQAKASANPLVASMADDPLFLQAVFAIQRDNWNDETQSTCTVEQAIKKAAKGAKLDLETELRGLRDRLNKGFAEPELPAAAAKLNGGGNGKKPAPKTAVVPTSAGAGGGPPKAISEMTKSEWAAYKAAKFAEADA